MSQVVELDPVLVKPLRRPERRAPQPRSAAQRTHPAVMRTAFAIVALTAVCAFAGRVTSIAAEPVLSTYRTGREVKGLELAVERQSASNEQLRRDIAYLRTLAGVEQEARRRGWVRPGEVALSVVVPEGAVPQAGALVLPADGAAPGARVDRIREAVDTCLAVFGGSRKAE